MPSETYKRRQPASSMAESPPPMTAQASPQCAKICQTPTTGFNHEKRVQAMMNASKPQQVAYQTRHCLRDTVNGLEGSGLQVEKRRKVDIISGLPLEEVAIASASDAGEADTDQSFKARGNVIKDLSAPLHVQATKLPADMTGFEYQSRSVLHPQVLDGAFVAAAAAAAAAVVVFVYVREAEEEEQEQLRQRNKW